MSVGERRARCYRKRGRPLLARGNGAAGPGLLSPHPRRPRPSGARSRPRRLVRRGGRHGLADHDRGREPLMATREHDNDQPASPWSRTSVQLSALFVLMLLVVGIAIAIFHHGSQHAHAGNAPATSQAGTPPATTTTSAAAHWPVLASRRRPTGALRELSPRDSLAARRHDEHPAIVHSWPAARPERDQRVLCAQSGRCAPGCDEPDGGGYDADLRAAGIRHARDRRALRCHDGAGGPRRCTLAYRSPVTSTTAIRRRRQSLTSFSGTNREVSASFQAPMRWTGNDWKYVLPTGRDRSPAR